MTTHSMFLPVSLALSPGGGADQVAIQVLCLARQELSWLLELLSIPPSTCCICNGILTLYIIIERVER